jgi:dihydrofolate reductase
MVFDIIAAAHITNNAIGKNGGLPWKNNTDMKYFREVTSYTTDPNKMNAVIMGRKTYESIGSSLKKRMNVVLSQTSTDASMNLCFHKSFDDALQMLYSKPNIENIFVIGGESVYKAALEHPQCRHIYLNLISDNCDVKDADAFFPAIDASRYKKIENKMIGQDVLNTVYVNKEL